MRLSGHLALMGQTKNIYKIFVKKHEGKIPLERSQSGKKNIIKTLKQYHKKAGNKFIWIRTELSS
jgi:hypothetical protein